MSEHDFGDDTDFNPPPEDYKTNDPPTYKCRAEVKCLSCGKNHGDCDIITDRMSAEEDSMINRSASSGQTQNGGGNKRQRNGLPFLSPKECSNHPQPAVVLAARLDDDNFNRGQQVVNLRIRFKGKDYTYGLRQNNPNLDTLCDAWGEDETTWVKKEVELMNEEDPITGRVYLRFAPAMEEDEEATQKDEAASVPSGRRKRS